jgi:hypothetical protein
MICTQLFSRKVLSLKRLILSIKYILCLPERVKQPFKYNTKDLLKKINKLCLFLVLG